MMQLEILSLFFIFQGSTGNSTSGAERVNEGGGRKGIYKGGGWETRFFRHLEKPWCFVIQYLFIPLKYLAFWSTEKIRVVLVDLIMIEAETNKSNSQNIMRAHRLFISWLSRCSKITLRSRLSSCWVPACPWAGGRGSWDESSSPKESWRRVKAKTGRK